MFSLPLSPNITVLVYTVHKSRGRQFKKAFQQILPQKQLIYQAFFVWPQSGAAQRPQSERL